MGLLKLFERFLLVNRFGLMLFPFLAKHASRFLLAKAPLALTDLEFPVSAANSYSLISEKNSASYNNVMKRLIRYIGAGSFGPKKHWEYPWVLSNLHLRPNMRVLDAGCGQSPIQFCLADLGCEVHGIDPAEDVEWHGLNRDLNKRFGTEIKYRRDSMESISYPNDFFDRVCSVSVIEHCIDQTVDRTDSQQTIKADRKLRKRMMNEMVRVLKPGGLLVITVDYYIPRKNPNEPPIVDVADMMSIKSARIYGNRCKEPFPGEEGFDYLTLISNPDIYISDYFDTLQTSIGFVMQKKD